MNVEVLHSTVSDNVFTLLRSLGECALVDPIDANLAIQSVRDSGDHLKFIFNTHWHPDHISGNDLVMKAFPEAELVSGNDAREIERLIKTPVHRVLRDRESVRLGDLNIEVRETPGHTAGHCSFLCEDQAFVGDTIFTAGCGHVRAGGDLVDLWRTFQEIESWEEHLTIHCGHDYAIRNLEFVLDVFPEHLVARQELELRLKGFRLATLGEERLYNIFMQTESVEVQNAIRERFPVEWAAFSSEMNPPEAAFRVLREKRDSW